ncbi:MAG: class I SAM-dependent methyltransferase [Endomicrobia bacterium]|nr:class I SAM-dependent methyltransferase [Endomicrobiia bacterium]
MGKIRLTEEKETLFIPLYGKAADYRSKKSILNDKTASDIVEKVDIDFTKHKRGIGERVFAARAKQYDAWAKDFIAKNQNAAVVHLGCGLDARITRIQPPSSVIWFDVDYPEVIDLRKQFYSENSQYKMISSSITAQNWLETIPSDRPALIIAEGVFTYLSEAEVKALLQRLTDYFSHGQIAFDAVNSSMVNARKEKLKEMGTAFRWVIKDISEADKLNPKLKRIETVSVFKSAFIKELPLDVRLAVGLLALFPRFKNSFQMLRYDF